MVTKAREQKLAISLRQKGKSLNEITRSLKISKSTASLWVRKVQLTKKQKSHLENRQKQAAFLANQKRKKIKPTKNQPRIVEKFFDTWTPEMAYVLGYFAADGCMYQVTNSQAYFIEFVSIDKELIVTTKKLMQATNNVEVLERPRSQPRYKLRVCSTKIFSKLLEIGFTPAKSLTMKFPDIPDNVLPHFIRGYFDGDGCAYFAKLHRKNSHKLKPILMARFTCGSKKFLEKLQERISTVSGTVGKGSLHPHNDCWDLSYSSRDARHLYNFMYPTEEVPCLKRKYEVFGKAFKQWA